MRRVDIIMHTKCIIGQGVALQASSKGAKACIMLNGMQAYYASDT